VKKNREQKINKEVPRKLILFFFRGGGERILKKYYDFLTFCGPCISVYLSQ